MFWRFVSRDFWRGGISKPMPAMIALSKDLIDFNVIFETASSTFQVSVWSLGMQHETKGS